MLYVICYIILVCLVDHVQCTVIMMYKYMIVAERCCQYDMLNPPPP